MGIVRLKRKSLQSERAKACDISPKVKKIVWERDGGVCIKCGTIYAMPNAHYIPRSKGGLGIEQNIVTLCQHHHDMMDNSTNRKQMLKFTREYLMSKYPDWDETKLVYRKGK